MPCKTDYSENITLIRQYRSGSAKALETLTQNNLNLVKSIASRFTGRGYDFEDLVETGVIGLLKALSGFDEKMGCEFSTYAFTMITGEIKRFLRDNGPIKISRTTKANAAIIAKARDDFYKKYGREPRISELAETTLLTHEEITTATNAMQPITSIEDEIYKDNILGDTLLIDGITDRLALRQAISSLDEHEQKIIKLRFYKNLTQTRVSKLLGMSQVSVSRAEKKIIDKLRQEIL